MSDLTERLRIIGASKNILGKHVSFCTEAADEIDRLTRELAEVREALEGMLQYAGIIEERCGEAETNRARRALKEKP
jgi:hypothetical protein